ncbi:hypothetical protein BH10CYA1_BH10CYA1_45530 [soil metagenome]
MTADKRSVLVNDLNNLRAIVESQIGVDDIKLIYVLRPLAELHASSGAHEEAVHLQRKIYKLCLKFRGNPILPALKQARQALASTLQSLKQYDEAITLFQALVAEDGDQSSYGSLVDCLQGVGRFDEAIAICESVVARVEQSTDEKSFGAQVSWLISLSRCYSRQGDFATAAQVTERTIPLMAARAEVICIPQLDVLAELYRQAGNQADHDRVRAVRREIADRCDY